MNKKKLVKKLLIASMPLVMALSTGSLVYADTQALPNGTITSQNGTKYLTDSTGEKYSGWFIDSKEDWYYFNESDKTMKTGWHHDSKDGYRYYLNLSDGKMVTGWQTIEGKEYFFQPVRDMGNYHFNDEQEKWLYSVNSQVPYGAMYVNTTTPDGSKVDSTGVKVGVETSTQTVNDNSSSGTNTVKNGWLSENGSWHYYESGTLAKNKWLNLDGKWYYVLSDGAMVSNTWKEVGGKSYYFGDDGVMYVNTVTPDGNKVDGNGAKIVNSTNGSTIAYDDFRGLYFEKGEYDEAVRRAKEYFDGDLEKAISSIIGQRGYDYLSIERIENGYVYGRYIYHGSFDDKYSSFDDGVKLNGNGFLIEMDFVEQGNSTAVVTGARDPLEDSYFVNCQLSDVNGTQTIILNGKSNKKFPESSNYVSSYESAIYKKISDKPITE